MHSKNVWKNQITILFFNFSFEWVVGLTSIYEFVFDSVNNIREFILFKNELKIFICAHVRNVDELWQGIALRKVYAN